MRVMARHRFLALILLVAAFSLFAGGCGDGDEGADEPSGDEQAQMDESLVEQAQEEGEVSVVTGAHTLEQIELLAQKFEQKYGITVNFSRQSSGAVAQQVAAQREAGAVEVDVVASNDETTMVKWADDGVITDPELPNRDQIDPTFDDGERLYLSFAWIPMGIMYNTTAVEEGELPSTWADFAEAAGDHPLVHADPRTSGVALSFVWAIDQVVGPEFYEGLASNEVITSESGTAVGTIILSGEADIALPGAEVLVPPLLEEGEPVGIHFPEDSVPGVENLIAQVADAPHPSAARLFVQYQMSEEFQQAQAEEAGTRSVLQDGAIPEGLPELNMDNVLLVDSADLQERRDELVQIFEQQVLD